MILHLVDSKIEGRNSIQLWTASLAVKYDSAVSEASKKTKVYVFKWIVYPNMKMMLFFTHPDAAPNLYD